jgi:uncharacterized protein (DUF58 family)
MRLDSTRLADPQTLARLSRLQLRARLVVEGVISGLHRSPYHGFSVEFAQHREYTPGDEIRYLDWKVFGRSDRFYVKQFEEETNLKAYLLLDSSDSMTYRSGELSKLEYGSVVAASLAQLMLQQRDAVGLALFNDRVQRYLPPRGLASHFTQMLAELEAPSTAPKTNLSATFHELAEQIKRRGLIIVISDLLGPVEETLIGLRHFRHRKHEVIVFHILDRDELEFPFDDLTRFDGLEGEPQLLVNPHAVRAGYLREFGVFLETLERGCREIDVDLVRMPTNQPVEQLLSAYLAARTRPGSRRGTGAR